MGQGLQNLDLSWTPAARQAVSHAERAHDIAVRATHREPGPGDHGRRLRRGTDDGARVQPGVLNDQLVAGVDHMLAQQLLNRALCSRRAPDAGTGPP
jgi:hypothetical protein